MTEKEEIGKKSLGLQYGSKKVSNRMMKSFESMSPVGGVPHLTRMGLASTPAVVTYWWEHSVGSMTLPPTLWWIQRIAGELSVMLLAAAFNNTFLWLPYTLAPFPCV